MTADNRPVTRRLAPLDGLRGLAIILVLCHHLFAHIETSWGWMNVLFRQLGQGWIGVDLFFVLSGFLITSILIRTRSDAHYIRNFYVRRFFRISPLYYAVVAVVFLVFVPLGWMQREAGAPPSAWFWFYGTNFLICRLGHFDLGIVNVPLSHLWSLAVEEHFYFVWPFIVLWTRPRYLWAVCLSLISVMIAARSWYVLSTHDWIAPYVHSGFRSDSLLVGGLVAIVNQTRLNRAKLRQVYFWLFAVFAVATVAAQKLASVSLGRDTLLMQTGGYTYLALVFGALVGYLSLTGDKGLLSVGFRSPLLRFFGQYSYGIYMFHPFMLTFFGLHQRELLQFLRSGGAEALLPVFSAILVTSASVGLALVSWHGFENPILKLKHRFEASEPEVLARNPEVAKSATLAEATVTATLKEK